MQVVADRTAFITGGASGIGLAMATVFARAGMNVVVADFSRRHLDAVEAQFAGSGLRTHCVELDVTDRAGWIAAADEAEGVFGHVHLLCNNAGVNVIRDVNEASFEDFDWLMSVNYGGTVNGVLTFLPRMRAHGEPAHIVNTCSIAGIEAGPGTSVYAPTKFAIRGFSEAIRYDLLPCGIEVSVVCPGTVDTRLYESEEHRQPRFRGTTDANVEALRERGGELFRKVLPMGMDPMLLAERVLRGIRAGAFYIFPHVEVERDVRDTCEEMLAAFTDDAPDPALERLEETRRQRKRDVLTRADRP
jgi:NAD(P)-dependent dehydrogenase (short-subunit alcohol dehydrogenase family)